MRVLDLFKLQEKRKKELQQRRLDAFLAAQEALEKEYGCEVRAVLEFTPFGIIPIAKSLALPEDEYQKRKAAREQLPTVAEATGQDNAGAGQEGQGSEANPAA